MKNIKKYFDKIIILSSLITLPSCVPVAVVTTGVVGTTLAGERTAGDRLDDNIIRLKVNEEFVQADLSEMYSNITVTVHEGRVLLTGSVGAEKYIKKASDITWKVKGVHEVINEIKIATKSVRDSAKDMLIANTIRSKILIEKNIRSVNYHIDTNNEIVYLLGVAQDQNELKKVIDIARTVKGVKKVVSHVILKNDLRRSKQV